MVNILVLGKGYISSKIEKYWSLNVEEYNLIRICRDEYNYTSVEIFKELLKKYKPKYVINCYGFTGKPNVDSCEEHSEDCYLMNYHQPVDLAKICEDKNIPFICISTGCIYNDDTGQKVFFEDDKHNFGSDNPTASTYSKSKSLFENYMVGNFNKYYILRIRMPFDDELCDKNYINKIIKYDKLVNYNNSVTYVFDLVKFIEVIIQRNVPFGVYNVVNENSITSKKVIEIYNNILNKNKNINNWYSTDDLLSSGLMKCRRSNCVLSTDKIKKYYPTLLTSEYAIQESLELFFNKNEK